MEWLELFVRESNFIEGIKREPTQGELAAHHNVLNTDTMTPDIIADFVQAVQPNAWLRDRAGMNVQVGTYIAPFGGVYIAQALRYHCETLNNMGMRSSKRLSPFELHREYEALHPFTDGNGRSGRALFLWDVSRRDKRTYNMLQKIGFLHTWYYLSLEGAHAY